MTSDSCNDSWVGVVCDSQLQVGVVCDSQLQTVRKIVLEGFKFSGTFDASSLCNVGSLAVLNLTRNNIVGSIHDEIGHCKSLTSIYLSENEFSGDIPEAFLQLSNLKKLHISKNHFSGQIPNLSQISGQVSFLAQDNQLTGLIPDFNFSNLQRFNVSNNNLTGPIPDIQGRFSASSFSGNPGLCGYPLNACAPSAAPSLTPAAEAPESFKNRILLLLFALAILTVS